MTAPAQPMTATKPPHIFVGLPCFASPEIATVQALERLYATAPKLGINVSRLWLPGDSHIDRSRNTVTQMFLASNADYLLWIDTDIIFAPEHVAMLLETAQTQGTEVTCGLYHKKQRVLNPDGSVRRNWVLNPDGTPQEGNLVNLRHGGTGFMLIRREVFDNLATRYYDDLWFLPHLEEVNDLELRKKIAENGWWGITSEERAGLVRFNFWGSGRYRYRDGTVEWLSEDWYFCQRCRDAGMRVVARTDVITQHIGRTVYPIDPISPTEVIQVGPATAPEPATSPEPAQPEATK